MKIAHDRSKYAEIITISVVSIETALVRGRHTIMMLHTVSGIEMKASMHSHL